MRKLFILGLLVLTTYVHGIERDTTDDSGIIPPDSTYYYPQQYNQYRQPGAFNRRVNQQRLNQQQQGLNYGNVNPPSTNPYYYTPPATENPGGYQNYPNNPQYNPTYPVQQNAPNPTYIPNTTYTPGVPTTTGPTYVPNNPAYAPQGTTYTAPDGTYYTPPPGSYTPGTAYPAAPAYPPPGTAYPAQTVPVPVSPVRPSYAPAPGQYGSGFSQQQGSILRQYDQQRDSILNSDRGSYNQDPAGSQQNRLKARAVKQQEELMKRTMRQQEQLGR